MLALWVLSLPTKLLIIFVRIVSNKSSYDNSFKKVTAEQINSYHEDIKPKNDSIVKEINKAKSR